MISSSTGAGANLCGAWLNCGLGAGEKVWIGAGPDGIAPGIWARAGTGLGECWGAGAKRGWLNSCTYCGWGAGAIFGRGAARTGAGAGAGAKYWPKI